MREIKFRGQRQSDNKWIYGDLLQPTELCDVYEISDCESIDGSRYDVIKHTIGQYTGLKDKNGTEIYEGDIVELKAENGCCNMLGKIIYDNYDLAFELIDEEGNQEVLWYAEQELEVIGNIYDNPELLKGE